jgi:diphosphomevalonate decarboxylase
LSETGITTMSEQIATARGYSNIAFIKYWGNRDDGLRLPSNGSISLNLAGLETVTTVRFTPELRADRLFLNGERAEGEALGRVSKHLDHIRRLAGSTRSAEIVSQNNFPMGTGIASSASAFSALTLAACRALGLELAERVLTTIARLGSGSASRSIPGGYVEWHAGADHESSYAESIAPAGHWNLIDLVAIASESHKEIGSTGGHTLAATSPLQEARVRDCERRLSTCKAAILARDFEALAAIAELDTLMMHAVMLTSTPALVYWSPVTIQVIKDVQEWRRRGTPAFFTIDAGPNVHVLTTPEYAQPVRERLLDVDGIEQVITGTPGGPAHPVEEHLNPPHFDQSAAASV